MLQAIPERHSPAAANAADRLRLLKYDIHLVELAIEMAFREAPESEDSTAIVLHLRRLQGEIDELSDDILAADKAKRAEGEL